MGFEEQGSNPVDGQRDLVTEMSEPLYRCKGWMKLAAVVMIAGGALYCLTIIGIIVAWLPIWMGVLLWQAASAVEDAHLSGREDAMLHSMGKLKTYFIITGVSTLIGIVFGVIGGVAAVLVPLLAQ